jgi:hypothetical protein
VAASAVTASPAVAQGHLPPPFVRIWLDSAATVQRGQPVAVAFTADPGTYVAVLRIDADGNVTILAPTSPNSRSRITSVDDVERVTFRADRADGVGYVVVLGSSTPMDFRAYRDRRGGWVPLPAIDAVNPYLTVRRFADRVTGGQRRARVALDYVPYSVGRDPAHDPRRDAVRAPAVRYVNPFDPWTDDWITPCWDRWDHRPYAPARPRDRHDERHDDRRNDRRTGHDGDHVPRKR